MLVEQQLHGYQHGHELLSGTIRLAPRDQDLVDRLSDVAGPLAPGERFAPYLSCYPLPSGSYYVVARTWQDREAPRAGCVRTRSLLVPMVDWASSADPAALVALATEAGPIVKSKRITVEASPLRPLQPVETAGVELLEALFLEESAPVVVFGAKFPEAIALRLLTALWPSRRSRFAVSTYCNSPRSISNRSFDLVFAPVDARPRFSDWKGRRVDGTRTNASRHRWSRRIADEVFKAPHPSLMALDAFGALAEDERGSEEALRLSLLWEELSRKVDAEPHAALGLLDIANTRAARRDGLVESLSPVLATAARNAVAAMQPAQAWRFLQVLIGKLGRTQWQLSLARSVRSSIISLARRQPLEAVAAVPSLLEEEGGDFLMSGIAEGLAGAEPFEAVGKGLAELPEQYLLRLLLGARELASSALGANFGIESKLLAAIEQTEPPQQVEAGRRFLQLLVADRHSELLRFFLFKVSGDIVVAEAERLRCANRLEQPALNAVVVEAAREAGVAAGVRQVVVLAGRSPAADAMLRSLLDPTAADVDWVLDGLNRADGRRQWLLEDVLGSASNDQLRSIVGRPGILVRILDLLGADDGPTELLAQIAETVPMEAGDLVRLVTRILPKVQGRRGSTIAAKALEKVLGREFGPERDKLVADLLDRAGGELDGARSIGAGAARGVEFGLASRNLVLFDRAAPATRMEFLKVPETLADEIVGRHVLDLSYEASEAVGRLLWDSSPIENPSFLRAAAKLLPFAMRENRRPASPIIAAAFPPVYRELQQESLPNFLSFIFPLLDWDRCKIARKELAEALLKSTWRPRDIALAAARAGDPERILRRVAKREHGPAAIAAIEKEIGTIPDPWGWQVGKAIREIAKDGGL